MADVPQGAPSAGDEIRRLPDLRVGGLTEQEIFALAPSTATDRVHWVSLTPLDPQRILPSLAESGLPGRTRQWSDGHQRIWVADGAGHRARDLIRTWCEDHGIDTANMRVEPNVPFRDVDAIPGGVFPALLAAAVDWLYPRTGGIRRRLMTELDIKDPEEVRSMMYLHASDLSDRYVERDGRLGRITFLTYLLGKMRTWPQDAARVAYGRSAMDDRIAMRQAIDQLTGERQHRPTEAEVADRLGISVTDLRHRAEAISSLDRMRTWDSLDDHLGLAAGGTDDAADMDDLADRAALTAALLDAVAEGERGAGDALGLAASYLAFWEGLSRADVARVLDILPKTASAAISRTVARMPREDLT